MNWEKEFSKAGARSYLTSFMKVLMRFLSMISVFYRWIICFKVFLIVNRGHKMSRLVQQTYMNTVDSEYYINLNF